MALVEGWSVLSWWVAAMSSVVEKITPRSVVSANMKSVYIAYLIAVDQTVILLTLSLHRC